MVYYDSDNNGYIIDYKLPYILDNHLSIPIWSQELKEIILNDLNNINNYKINYILLPSFKYFQYKIKNDIYFGRNNLESYIYKIRNEYIPLYEIITKIISYIFFNCKKLPKNIYILPEYEELLPYLKLDKYILYFHLIKKI